MAISKLVFISIQTKTTFASSEMCSTANERRNKTKTKKKNVKCGRHRLPLQYRLVVVVVICVWMLDKCQDFFRSKYRSGRLHASNTNVSVIEIFSFKLILIIILCISKHPKLINVRGMLMRSIKRRAACIRRVQCIHTTVHPTLADLLELCSWSDNNNYNYYYLTNICRSIRDHEYFLLRGQRTWINNNNEKKHATAALNSCSTYTIS